MRKQKNISFPVLTLLFLIFYPGIIKLAHVHHNPNYSSEQGERSVFSQTDEPCAVCDFQFVNFIGSLSELSNVNIQEIVVADNSIPGSSYIRYLTYFSLRAPPEA